MAKRKTSRLRRWTRRLAILLAVILIAALLAPFFFTTTLARWALAHSAYAKFNPTIAGASLGPTGALTLTDVEFFEAGPLSDAPLLSVQQARVSFSWWKVLGMTISTARLNGLVVHVRPGRTYPVTLLTLASYPPGTDGTPPSPPSAAPSTPSKPFWFDQLHATGTLKVHTFESFQIAERNLPLTFDMTMHGARNDPHRDLSLALGEPATARAIAATQSATSTAPARRPLTEVGPAMTASVRIIPLGDGKTQIMIDHGEAWNLAATLPAELLRQLSPSLENSRDKTHIEAGRLSITGSIDPTATARWFHGQLEVHDLALDTGQAPAFNLDQFSFSAKVETPLAGGSLTDVAIHDATTGLGTLQFGSFRAGRTQAEWSLEKGLLDLRTLQAAAFDGTLTGNAKIQFSDFTQSQAKLTLEHIEAQQFSALVPVLAQDHAAVTLHGHFSGDLEITPAAGGLEGKIGLLPANDLVVTADALSLSPAPWNPTPTQAHQLEARITAARQAAQWSFAVPQLALASLTVHSEADALHKKWPALPTDIKGPLELTIGSITGDEANQTQAGKTQALAHVRLQDVSLQAPQSKDYPVAVEKLASTATLTFPLGAAASGLEIPALTLTASKIQWSKMLATDLAIDGTLLDNTWRAKENQMTLFGSNITGDLLYHQNNNFLEFLRLTLQHLDQHQLLAAMSPEKVDAEGISSGPLEIWNILDSQSGRGGPLQFKGNLVAEGPGKLMIKDEEVAQQMVAGLNQTTGELLPQNFGDIVKGQLKNYPYLEGHVTLESVENHPVLHLNYRRAPLTEGEPGYGIKQVIGGQPVVANYPINLNGVTIRFGNKSVAELLEMLAGWENQILQPKLPPAK